MASEQHEPILVSKALAARLLSISIDSFERTVMPGLRNVRIGRRVLFAVADLGAWVEEHAAVPLVSDMPQTRLRNSTRQVAHTGLASTPKWR